MEHSDIESGQEKVTQLAIQKILADLDQKIKDKDFDLDDGSTEDVVLKRAELLMRVLEKLPQIVPLIVRSYRAILNEQGLDRERTGRLSLYVVGGRIHNQTKLKSWSDIDMVFAVEKPWLIGRKRFLTKEEDVALPEPRGNMRTINVPFRQEIANSIIPRLGELISTDLSNEGVLEIKPSGDQRSEDINNGVNSGVCLYTET